MGAGSFRCHRIQPGCGAREGPPAIFLRDLPHVAPWGFSVNVFPLRHVVVEPHLRLPLVHRVRNRDLLRRRIQFLSRIGMGMYDHTQESLEAFARRHAGYLLSKCHLSDFWRGCGACWRMWTPRGLSLYSVILLGEVARDAPPRPSSALPPRRAARGRPAGNRLPEVCGVGNPLRRQTGVRGGLT